MTVAIAVLALTAACAGPNPAPSSSGATPSGSPMGIEGGVQGLALHGPDGKTYGFMLRPLLVDETG